MIQRKQDLGKAIPYILSVHLSCYDEKNHAKIKKRKYIHYKRSIVGKRSSIAFLIDISGQLNNLNITSQGKDQRICRVQ